MERDREQGELEQADREPGERGQAARAVPIVKICGVTRVEDARRAVNLGAAMIGINLWPGSPRHLDEARAREVARAVGGRALLVGVFVRAETAAIRRAEGALGLDLLQFHGDETPETLAPWAGRALKAFRVRRPPADRDLAAFAAVWGFLFDAHVEDLPGGTGRTWDWRALAGLTDGRPRLVAGGVRPGNAARALAESGATGIDVCSGVESAPGIKDAGQLERLFAEVTTHAVS